MINGLQTAIDSLNAPEKVFCKTLLGLPCGTIVNKIPLMEDFNLLTETEGIMCLVDNYCVVLTQ